MSSHEETGKRLIFHATMSNEAVALVAKETGRPWYMKIDSNEFIDINKIYEFWGSEMSDVFPQLHVITGCYTSSHKFKVVKVHIFKNVCRNSSNITLIKILGANITMTELIKRQEYNV